MTMNFKQLMIAYYSSHLMDLHFSLLQQQLWLVGVV